MPVYLNRLIPPRPSFAADMSPEERNKMMEHAAYWRAQAEKGVAIVFGPVKDPKGVWGLGVAEAADDAAMSELLANDPVIKANLGLRYETLPLISAMIGKRP